MRFVDFLRATVLLSAGAATTLGVLTLVAAPPLSRTVARRKSTKRI